ncbi:MAG: hypothetical protein EOO46_09505 [Flavobacterium sp.]|nr:MAG: hypothetical protein EOO46_09505 [Flavobacterium sp.]
MKINSALLLSFICIQLFACSKNNEVEQTNNVDNISNTDTTKMKITIGSAVFTATLNNNATVSAFKAMLPFTITMSELNGNEKFYNFSTTLPTNASSGGNTQVGDLMLYGNNCLVLFYESFKTSYSYTRLGKIDNTTGLVAALGAGGVTIKFEKQ